MQCAKGGLAPLFKCQSHALSQHILAGSCVSWAIICSAYSAFRTLRSRRGLKDERRGLSLPLALPLLL